MCSTEPSGLTRPLLCVHAARNVFHNCLFLTPFWNVKVMSVQSSDGLEDIKVGGMGCIQAVNHLVSNNERECQKVGVKVDACPGRPNQANLFIKWFGGLTCGHCLFSQGLSTQVGTLEMPC